MVWYHIQDNHGRWVLPLCRSAVGVFYSPSWEDGAIMEWFPTLGVPQLQPNFHCPVSWGCRIYWLNLCRGVRPPSRVSYYDTKQSDGEVPVMLEHWGMWRTTSLPMLPGPLWPGIVAPDRTLSMGLIELHTYAKLNCLN